MDKIKGKVVFSYEYEFEGSVKDLPVLKGFLHFKDMDLMYNYEDMTDEEALEECIITIIDYIIINNGLIHDNTCYPPEELVTKAILDLIKFKNTASGMESIE